MSNFFGLDADKSHFHLWKNFRQVWRETLVYSVKMLLCFFSSYIIFNEIYQKKKTCVYFSKLGCARYAKKLFLSPQRGFELCNGRGPEMRIRVHDGVGRGSNPQFRRSSPPFESQPTRVNYPLRGFLKISGNKNAIIPDNSPGKIDPPSKKPYLVLTHQGEKILCTRMEVRSYK